MNNFSLPRNRWSEWQEKKPPEGKRKRGPREAQVEGTPPLGAWGRGGDDGTPRVGKAPSLKSLSLGSPGTSASKAERTAQLR